MSQTQRSGRFEDIVVWQKSRDLVKAIYLISSKGEFSRDFHLKNQIRKAVISIPSNIAEGFGRHSKKEFLNYLSIARGSLFEVRCQLILAYDLRYISTKELDDLASNCFEINRLLGGLRKAIKKTL